jgi:DNA polymerase delta subunit 1
MYGFCGVTRGALLSCVAIAAATTCIGRSLIMSTKATVESTFMGSRVIYGDTDSVMIQLARADVSVAEAMAVGRQVAALVTSKLPAPIKLEFEKIYCPYLLLTKKRYAGLLFATQAEQPDYLDVKGLQNVRSDASPLLRETIDQARFQLGYICILSAKFVR